MKQPSPCPSCHAPLVKIRAVGKLDVDTMKIDVQCTRCKSVFPGIVENICKICNIKIPYEAKDCLCTLCRN